MSSSIACIDIRDNKVFIAKRQMKGDMGGRWEFPGGKIDEGENPYQAIKREMCEEFGVEVEIFEKLAEVNFEHHGKKCSVSAYRVRFLKDGISEPFTLSEHTEYKWTDWNSIPQLNFVDSDLKLYELINNGKK